MSLVRQFLCTGIVCYLCISMGVTFTWPSSTLLLFSSENTTLHRPMTEGEQALFGSLSSIGALVSTPAAGFLLDVIGRKYCATLFSIMYVIAWVMIIVSNRVEVLLTAIFISGVGGAAFLVVPLYVSEFCQESIRGGMASGSVIFYAVGMIVSYTLGGYVDYYPMLYTCLSIAVVGVVLLSFLKESPMFLMKRGREQEAAKSMAFYRATKVSSKVVQQELETIRRILDAAKLDETEIPAEEKKLRSSDTVKPAQKVSTLKFIKKSYPTRRALLVTMVLTTTSVFQGLVVVQVYAETLFSKAIPTMSATISSIIFSIITLVSGLVSAYLTDIAGRKPLMLCSSLASGVCCVLLGSQIHMGWAPHAVTAVIIYTFCVAYSLGSGTIPFVLSAEVFLPEVKGILSMLVIEWAWLCGFIILFVFTPLVAAIGLGQIFYLFAAVGFANSVFTYFFLPETKGLPVDVIQTLFDRKRDRRA
ncbi:facilitated trehalose transporter Tret1-like [Cydia strobilella]|uniref:facilitated trehalose transporter Tret1-like n=1 Tax=Cydia strobilella TaxID=1100964 RepID=UPI00300696BE